MCVCRSTGRVHVYVHTCMHRYNFTCINGVMVQIAGWAWAYTLVQITPMQDFGAEMGGGGGGYSGVSSGFYGTTGRPST